MSKFRYLQIFGIHAVEQVFVNDGQRIVEMWVQQGKIDPTLQKLIQEAQVQGLAVQIVPRKTLDRLSEGGNHQGIIIRCRLPPLPDNLEDCLANLTTPPFLLILDGVQDPHNLGACLRTADAVGVQVVIVPKDRACALSPTVYKVASGAADNVPLLQVTNLAQTLRWLKEQGIWIVGASQDTSQNLFTTHLPQAIAVVLGAEGGGIRRLTRELCDVLVHIPMFGKVESLNVSVAVGVCLYEVIRQRTAP